MNCKPGDLAIVIGARCTPENIGCVVEVIRPAANLEQFQSVEGTRVPLDLQDPCWVCRSPRPMKWRAFSGSMALHFIELPIGDCHLRPISGIPVHDEVTDEVTV